MLKGSYLKNKSTILLRIKISRSPKIMFNLKIIQDIDKKILFSI